jgi:hypothetical protein
MATIKHAHQTSIANDVTKDVSATAWNEAHILTSLTSADISGLGSLALVGDAVSDGTPYVRKNAAWVSETIATLGNLASLNDATSDGSLYSRKNGAWTQVVITGTAASLTALGTIALGVVAYETDTTHIKVGNGTTAYASLNYQTPLPQTAAGVGQFLAISSPLIGQALVLPSGGTWVWWEFLETGGAFNSIPYSGISAGGTTIGAATALNFWFAFCWRIA